MFREFRLRHLDWKYVWIEAVFISEFLEFSNQLQLLKLAIRVHANQRHCNRNLNALFDQWWFTYIMPCMMYAENKSCQRCTIKMRAPFIALTNIWINIKGHHALCVSNSKQNVCLFVCLVYFSYKCQLGSVWWALIINWYVIRRKYACIVYHTHMNAVFKATGHTLNNLLSFFSSTKFTWEMKKLTWCLLQLTSLPKKFQPELLIAIFERKFVLIDKRWISFIARPKWKENKQSEKPKSNKTWSFLEASFSTKWEHSRRFMASKNLVV